MSSRALVVIRIQVGDEDLIGNLADLLHQTPERRPFDTLGDGVDHRTELAAVAVRDRLEQLGSMAFLKGVVRCFEHDSRVCSRQVARVRDRAGIVNHL
ncbi:hypothetical protein EMGR_006710 [Emarellia grisea]